MDSINKTMNNLSLYEVKAYVRKAQNVVLSLTEMEAKVREATNNEPWGAPSSLMQQIAAGTYNYREREEIINMIFRRFTEKSAHEWRQIYKALQLLEYIVKNGSEKFVDDARANVKIIQMLKSFHYIDSQGRDQGVNVRNRSKQLITLLNDESTIRQERKKARQNQKKFGGVAGGKSSVNPNNRFTGTFDDDDDGDDYGTGAVGSASGDFGGYQNRVFGDGGVYGERYEEERPASTRNDQFEEYEVGSGSGNGNSKKTTTSSRTSKATTKTSNVNATASAQAAAASQPAPEIDLFALDDGPSTNNNNGASSHANGNDNDDDDDDDFDDFQSAAPSAQATPAPGQGGSKLNSQNLSGLFGATNTSYQPSFQQQQPYQQQPQPTQTYSTHQPIPGSIPSQPSYNIASSTSTIPTTSTTTTRPKNNDAFSSLFSNAKTQTVSRSASGTVKPTPSAAKTNTTTTSSTAKGGNDDDFFGSFSSPAPAPAQHNNNNNNGASQKSNNNDELDLLSF